MYFIQLPPNEKDLNRIILALKYANVANITLKPCDTVSASSKIHEIIVVPNK